MNNNDKMQHSSEYKMKNGSPVFDQTIYKDILVSGKNLQLESDTGQERTAKLPVLIIHPEGKVVIGKQTNNKTLELNITETAFDNIRQKLQGMELSPSVEGIYQNDFNTSPQRPSNFASLPVLPISGLNTGLSGATLPPVNPSVATQPTQLESLVEIISNDKGGTVPEENITGSYEHDALNDFGKYVTNHIEKSFSEESFVENLTNSRSTEQDCGSEARKGGFGK